MKTVLILGATGLVGQNLVKICCASKSVDLVKIFVRKKLSSEDQENLFGITKKLEVHVVDFDLLSKDEKYISGDILLSALGSTIKKAKTKENFFHIDHDYNLLFARIALRNGIRTMGIVSSIGANKDSASFYLSTKGILEEHLRELAFQKLVTVRPSFLVGKRGDHRLGEKIGINVLTGLKPMMLGALKKYAPIQASEVAKTLVDLCISDLEVITSLEWSKK